MFPTLKNLGKSAVLAGAVGLMALLGSSASASAHYTTTRCDADGDHCWVVRCDDDGDDCHYVRDYHVSEQDRHAHWVCDWDGDDCHWVYDEPREHPSIGLSFGFSN